MADKLSIKEKVGYALGDTAANFIFQTMVMFQLAFYTDTFGITAAAAGTLLVVVRVWDAIFDPIMGIVADRTKTRWGKFRPWILGTAVPFGIMGFLAFVTPDFSASGKLLYAYITYIVLMMVYSANNLPYSALSGVMTGDLGERTSLSSYRFVFAMLAQLIIQGLALPMVSYFGQGSSAQGYQYTMAIFSTLAVILFFITFSTTKERIQPDPAQKASVKQHYGDLMRNRPWIAMFILTLILFITLAMRGSVVFYYFRYYIGTDNYESLFSLFNVFGTTSTIVGIFFSKGLAMKFGKRNVFIGGLAGTTLFTALFVFLPPSARHNDFRDGDAPAVCLRIHNPTAMGDDGRCGGLLGMEEQTQGYGNCFLRDRFCSEGWLGIRRCDYRICAGNVRICPQCSSNRNSAERHRMTMSIFPAITFGLCIVCLSFYRINKQAEIQITNELAERRKTFATLIT